MRAVDTNLLVRLLVRDDARQVASAEAFIERGAWVSHIVLVETVWVLDAVYGRTHAQLVNALSLLLSHAQLTVQDEDVVAAALAHYRNHPALGFSDCLVLEVARKAGHLPLGTFDKRLARIEGATRA
jgi:predicted nucleic-acid-binding protein